MIKNYGFFWIRCPIFIFRHYSFCRNYFLLMIWKIIRTLEKKWFCQWNLHSIVFIFAVFEAKETPNWWKICYYLGHIWLFLMIYWCIYNWKYVSLQIVDCCRKWHSVSSNKHAFASKNMCIFNRFLVAKCVVHKKKFPVVHPTFFPN